MKCLKCGVNAGEKRWYLTIQDFIDRGIDADRFDSLNCFCSDCVSDYSIETLDNYLFFYWQSLQQTQAELQQVHDSAEQPTKKHYYKWHPLTECVKVSQHFSSNLGQALQYIWRSETLNPNAVTKGQSLDEIVKDLEKAQAFIQYEIDRLRGN